MSATTRHRWALRLAQICAGILIGLAAAESIFSARDHGAFPHLNIYVADGALGVRLRPGASERISFSGNPVTSVRINSSGLRGADAPAMADVLVVGDSQAFGLGVEEEQTFAAQLGALSGKTVINGGVPTYGPAEYNAVLAEELAKHHPKIVIYTVNMANDLFEAAHPNRKRHAVWDGWAVRRENAPQGVHAFPGRAWLFGHSHAVFALRGWWYKRHPARQAEALADEVVPGFESGGVPSEGDWSDLLLEGNKLSAAHEQARRAADAQLDERRRKIKETKEQLATIEKQLEPSLPQEFEGEELPGIGTLRAAFADPGDIVRIEYGEGSRPVPATAATIRQAALYRTKVAEELKKKQDREALATLAKMEALHGQLINLRMAAPQHASELLGGKRIGIGPPPAPAPSPLPEVPRTALQPHLERAKELCDAAGARLVVLALPLDVQVSASEWTKYHAKPLEMESTRVLQDDVVAAAGTLGAEGVDATRVLAAAEPGAFLDGDLHLTPKGHAAVARLLADTIKRPPVRAVSASPLPLDRSPVPTAAEWAAASSWADNEGGYALSDLRSAGCRALRVREWLRVTCRAKRADAPPPTAVEVTRRGRSEAMAIATGEETTLVAAVLERDGFSVVFSWPRTLRMLTVDWPTGEDAPTMWIGDNKSKHPTFTETAPVKRLCECARLLSNTGTSCAGLYGSPDPDCERTYPKDCAALLKCAQGNPAFRPQCASGQVNVGAAGRCAPACAGPDCAP